MRKKRKKMKIEKKCRKKGKITGKKSSARFPRQESRGAERSFSSKPAHARQTWNSVACNHPDPVLHMHARSHCHDHES